MEHVGKGTCSCTAFKAHRKQTQWSFVKNYSIWSITCTHSTKATTVIQRSVAFISKNVFKEEHFQQFAKAQTADVAKLKEVCLQREVGIQLSDALRIRLVCGLRKHFCTASHLAVRSLKSPCARCCCVDGGSNKLKNEETKHLTNH